MLEELQMQETFEDCISLSDKTVKTIAIQLSKFATNYLCFIAVTAELQAFPTFR